MTGYGAEDTLNIALNGEGEDTPLDMMLEFTRSLAGEFSAEDYAGMTFRYEVTTTIVVIEGPRALLQRVYNLASTAPDVWPEWAQE